MGCTSSREVRRDRFRGPSPFVRSFSMPATRRSQPKSASFHFAALESSDEEMMKCTNDQNMSPLKKCPPGGERKVVLYLTSLRGVRKTFEDCCNVKAIIQGYGFRIDERDVSMHGGFKDELHEILGPGCCGSKLPRVFANGKCLGGAEEVRKMHEAGELEKALRDCEVVEMKDRWSVEACEGCGDVRFVPCETCSGSCKVFVEEDEEGGEEIRGFRRCWECNENGLVRCPLCCY
ncbi:Uncharacterized protein MA16_Dca013516 [Dendrobium catenatum]|uniref:Glutaredoxin domain-containing protein n=1 Tax=Dendrobium catenatum TaxID=906689 RepID=A0A2I0W4A1_9ASPA|nr:Uncharacterized protein MA16_Dca013516 [Dendrobium catenatum]